MEDTIAAIATSSGIASVGIIRISGEKTFEIIKKIFVPKVKCNKIKQQIKYGHIIDDNEIIDEVLVSYFVAPNSFTKENVCEINCHGGTIILNNILKIILKYGARLAMPGEFTKRAFINGRIDLLQAEAVIGLINAKTDKMLKESQKQLEGVLSKRIDAFEVELLDLISDIEATVDYPEYDVEEVTKRKIEEKINIMENELEKLICSFDSGKILSNGIKLALVGKPNVGKSSILNMLLREERAIVTDIAGTTRDLIEEDINIKGILVRVIDTAGIRNTEDEIEKIGVDKANRIIEDADIVLCVIDISKTLDDDDKKILESIKDKKNIIVLNKNDLFEKKNNIAIIESMKFENIIKISAKNLNGLNELEDIIFKLCNIDDNIKDNEVIISNVRHFDILSNVLERIKDVEKDIKENIPVDIISIKLMEALKGIGEITGKTVSEEVINTIFKKFCLGK